ncbi:hypothetical protein JW879_07055 [candidate division WOR-3 bacterium]|nr:hypothetical protein [candidate division WOR-3 bacterium]
MAKCINCKYCGKWQRKFADSSKTIYGDGSSITGMLYMACQAPNPPTTNLISEREAMRDEPCSSYKPKSRWMFWK